MSGSASLTASQLFEQEALSRKNAAAASNALSMAEYVYNYPGMPEGAKAVMHHLKLDLEILGMREHISLVLQKNAITEVPPNSPGFYSNVFLVRKASGGWHSVIDLKNLNAHIWAPHFHMFTTSSVLSTVGDLQDAYFHVPIHPSSRKYLRFAFENKVYQFLVHPFGLNTTPQVFTPLGHTVAGYLHCLGILVVPYLDDWLIHHLDRQVLLQHQAQLLETLNQVGFVLSKKKSELQDIQFL